MAFTPFSPRKLAVALASGEVSPRDQALYLLMSFLVWMLPYYLFIIPPITTAAWFYLLHAYEAFALVVINFAGVFFCLNKCRVNPSRHFLVDFTCLYGPVSLYVLVIGWGLYHGLIYGTASLLSGLSFESEPPSWLLTLYSSRGYDLFRYLIYVGVWAAIFLRIGYHLEKISEQRSDG